ncbi:transposase [Streptomyces sp. NPDC050392]|uniref:transposase n=1 Tax=Streptomyces sp. NPDC050392 TaxID=3155782 RepID=UPI00342FA8BD
MGQSPAWPWRQLIDGIRFRVRTGVPRRDVPGEYGPWGRIYDLFRRWQRDGTWHRSSPDQCGWERAADCAGARAGRGRPSTSVRDGRRGGSGGGESLGLGAVSGVWRGWCWSAREGFRQGGRPARLAALGDGGDVCALEGVVGVAHQFVQQHPFHGAGFNHAGKSLDATAVAPRVVSCVGRVRADAGGCPPPSGT